MNIGILTFHWATNYGAVLQCYALQSYLTSIGHNVKVINYKPRQYDESLYKFLRYRKFLHWGEYINTQKREKALNKFRYDHLNQTERVYTCDSIYHISSQFDVIISGSDQVANPSFLMAGEGKGKVTPSYFLGIQFVGKKIGYALSFGCTTYPEDLRKIATKYMGAFDRISVRETSGIDIVKSIGRDDAAIVPDPTLLMDSTFYHSLADEYQTDENEPYVYSFFIRNIADRKLAVNNILKERIVLWNNEDRDYTMQGWLSKIKHADFVLTDSFHCVVMCVKLHKPFIVVTEQKGKRGMNDRLYTLLNKLDLSQQIIFKDDLFNCVFTFSFDWTSIDLKLLEYGKVGKCFLTTL